MNKRVNILVKLALVAALYVVLTIAIAPISYGPIQVRFSEVLILLAFYDKRYVYSLTIGCIIANLLSPLGIVDVVVGSLGTYISAVAISKTKSLLLATFWPTIFCLPVVLLLHLIVGLPFFIYLFGFMVGEFISVTLIGYPLAKILSNKEVFMKKIALNS
ncbi:MAG: QueT transporter family protein [Clostridium chrysemydis]|uniref:QueT transporter family protein n=1 Tax=Clostridium TaxID=1485 RepID=UPI002152C697|nr:QueT transporter family protein [Clostridium sp. LY3-2]MCR6515543.1 QueT transporter family protein [Clostridium sp. LY3-2]